MELSDFTLTETQLHELNAFIKDRYLRRLQAGSDGAMPQLNVRFEFLPIYGRSVYVSFEGEPAEKEIERWSLLRIQSVRGLPA